MEKLEDFRQLKVWQKSHQLVLEIYKLTKEFPAEERFGLVPQMRRTAVSIAANIAEGFKKRGKKDKINFYNIAQGSLQELSYYLILCKDLQYEVNSEHTSLAVEETGKMLTGLIRSTGS